MTGFDLVECGSSSPLRHPRLAARPWAIRPTPLIPSRRSGAASVAINLATVTHRRHPRTRKEYEQVKIVTMGRGNVGGGLAQLWERAGHQVTRLGREGGDVSDTDVVLMAVPGGAIAEAIAKLTGIDRRMVIDATNLYGVVPPAGFPSNAEFVKSKTNGPTAKSFNVNFRPCTRGSPKQERGRGTYGVEIPRPARLSSSSTGMPGTTPSTQVRSRTPRYRRGWSRSSSPSPKAWAHSSTVWRPSSNSDPRSPVAQIPHPTERHLGASFVTRIYCVSRRQIALLA